MKQKFKFSTKHECKLDDAQLKRELPTVAPFSSGQEKLCDKFKKWTLASRWNPNYKTYFRSDFALFRERRRQLRDKNCRHIIHPLSRFAIIREIIMTIIWIIVLIFEPFAGTFLTDAIRKRKKQTEIYFIIVLNLILLIDMVLQFYIGFIVQRTKEIVLEPKRICRQYLKTYFFFDAIPTIYVMAASICRLNFFQRFLTQSSKQFFSTVRLFFLRFARIYTVNEYLTNIFILFKFRESIVKCLTIAVFIVIVIHWWSCIIYLIPTMSYSLGYPFAKSEILQGVLASNRTLTNTYIEVLLNTICHLFGAGTGNMKTQNPVEQFVLSLMLMWGAVCHIYVIAVVLQLFGTINISESKYEELIYQLNEYMVTKKLPQELRKRLLIYYEYRFQKHFFHEHLILNSLSEHLKYEVLLYSCRNLINKVKIFQGASKEVIGSLVAMLKQEVCLPNDVIIKSESLNENVYFISYGTVAVYLPGHREALHIEDGHHFGEVQSILKSQYDKCVESIVAVEITEVFYINIKDFWYVISTNPDIADVLEKSAIAKIAYLKSLIEEPSDNIVDISDVLLELRKGRILDKGRRRI